MSNAFEGMPSADGTDAYQQALMFAGPTKASAEPKLADVLAPGRYRSYNLPAGTTTLSLALLAYRILASYSPASTTVTIPLMSALGITYNTAAPLEAEFTVEQRGNGLVFVNGASGVTVDFGTLAPETLPKFTAVKFRTVGLDRWVAC